MKLRDYIRSLSNDQIGIYADACGTTPYYILVHLVYAKKTPRPALLKALAFNSGGLVTDLEVLQHFGLIGSGTEDSIATEAAS